MSDALRAKYGADAFETAGDDGDFTAEFLGNGGHVCLLSVFGLDYLLTKFGR